MSLYIGIDSGTQSVKAIVFDAESKAVVASGQAPHRLVKGLPAGHLEQRPEEWVTAMNTAIAAALESVDRSAVVGMGVSGQQHGFVPLDDMGRPLRAAKLWCDTSTVAECAAMTEALGGEASTIEKTGNRILPGFTAPKILWLKRNEPENFSRLRHVLLPHDYLNHYLTGEYFMEYGDASGTALMDIRSRAWSAEAIGAIDDDLADWLPSLSSSDQPCGTLRAEVAENYGLSSKVLVSAGGGDNMMGAIGTGNVSQGIATASFGTSGTIYACNESPVVDPKGEIAAFCDSTNRYLPLMCTMNVTTASEAFRTLLRRDHGQLSSEIESVPAGSRGLVFLPYLEGERTPSIPDGSGVFIGLNKNTVDSATLLRATIEGVTLGMNYGLLRLKSLGTQADELRLTGGGARNAAWRQIIADVFGLPVVCMVADEGAALGAALQAQWCREGQESSSEVAIDSIIDGAVALDESTRLEPDSESHAHYQQLQSFHNKLSQTLKPVFAEHAAFK